MARMPGKVIADLARETRSVIDDATADDNEVVVLVALLTAARTIILADSTLCHVEPLREMVRLGDEFVALLTDGEVHGLRQDAEQALVNRARRLESARK